MNWRAAEAAVAVEIERKFLVVTDAWKAGAVSSRKLCQFYLTLAGRSSVRVRIEGERRASLTVKAASGGRSRLEFEYDIPVDDAREMMALAEGSVIEKIRHIVPYAGLDWEVDVFAGENEGLVIAEAELECVDQPLDLPPWVGPEITDDRRYYNACLAQRPLKSWQRTAASRSPSPAAAEE
jgi:adenylate cyclase